MYYSIGIVLLALLLVCIVGFCKRYTSIRKVRSLPFQEKKELLTSLIYLAFMQPSTKRHGG